MQYSREFTGEFFGTFLLVFLGCGSSAVSILFDAYQGLFPVAILWGASVCLAIYATRHLSCSHLNPAVSIAMALSGRMIKKKLPTYLGGQFLGAFFAGLILYLLFNPFIASFEAVHAITRGSLDSVQTARIFSSYYQGSLTTAMLAEGLGTFFLVMMIFSLTEGCNLGRPGHNLSPVFIGITLTVLIGIFAPLTQAALNPARDLAPRVVAWIFGWKSAAFPDSSAVLLVYLAAPILGAALAGLFFTRFLEPQMNKKKTPCACQALK